ncbi:MAG: DUF2391 family protein [Nanoarchaeota archaeon]|nr:DUF2391 family protein [Nanoarchaeota archaeon]
MNKRGRFAYRIISPLKVEFRIKDMVQIIIGASILAIPVGFTEETWKLGGTLPLINVLGLLLISVLFISIFVYYTYHRNNLRCPLDEYLKRIISTYIFSFLVVAVLLSVIKVCPWTSDFLLAIKRVIIVTFPASMSAAIADTIR